jgi:prepilin-type N-terminal cleavage/methylation domain-containing protein
MHFQRALRTHDAFTLIELLIVILIVSLIYYFGFSGFDISKPKPRALTPLNLTSTIQNAEWFNGHATLLCVNHCKTCYLRRDIRAKFQPYKNPIDLAGVVPYTIDERDDLQEIEYGRYDDQPICLVMDFYDNGSATQIILKQRTYAYFLPAFFGKPKRFDAIEDAKAYWLRYDQMLSDRGDYY